MAITTTSMNPQPPKDPANAGESDEYKIASFLLPLVGQTVTTKDETLFVINPTELIAAIQANYIPKPSPVEINRLRAEIDAVIVETCGEPGSNPSNRATYKELGDAIELFVVEHTTTKPTDKTVATTPIESDGLVDKVLQDLVPKEHCPSGCDGHGTYAEADSDGDPVPAPCQYCFEVRLPLIDQAKAAIQAQVDEAVREARLDELRTISGGKYLRNIHTVVEDANGDVYEDDYRSYISDYEVQERIEQLTTQSRQEAEQS